MTSNNNLPQRPKRPANRSSSARQSRPDAERNRQRRNNAQDVDLARGIKGTLSIIGKTLATIFFIMVITGSIVASVMTVYVVNFLDDQTEYNLRDLNLKYTTTLYAVDSETGEDHPLQVIKGDDNRIWINFEDIPDTMQLAVIAAEDKRFQTHQGVDWKMTFKAFLNMLKPGGETTGGSTITQQLIKNISGEKEVRVDRKIREIFRALALEKEYSKDDIMEAYLNTIGLGGNTYGIQAASNRYFGKNVQELDKAECAAIIAITQNPSKLELFNHEEENRVRRSYILDQMLDIELTQLKARLDGKESTEYGPVEGGSISQSEYEKQKKKLESEYAAAKKEKLVIQPSAAQQTRAEIYSYFVDYVIEEVMADLMDQYGYEKQKAWDMVYNGGLSIYTTVDERIQGILDEKFITNEIEYDPETSIFQNVKGQYIINGGQSYGDYVDGQPQCAMVIMDYEGNIKGIAGGRGEKTGDRTFNLATDGVRQTGSSIKPLSVYGPAVDLDLVHWSYMTADEPFGYLVDGRLVRATEVETVEEEDEDGNIVEKKKVVGTPWPVNYDAYRGPQGIITINRALQNSVNTVAVKTLDLLTPQVSYDFLYRNLNIKTLDPDHDIDYAPLALGAQSGGVSVLDMTAAYQIFGNGGLYYEPHSYTRVVDSQGNVLLESDDPPRRVISEDTAEVMNRLLQSVVTGGTGSPAALGYVPVMGKTGTSNMDKDQWFMGGTPNYVAGVWFGFDKENAGIPHYNPYPPPQIWKRIMSEVDAEPVNTAFPVSGSVVQETYCAESGDLATPSCPKTGVGWYKESALPGYCSLHSGVIESEEVD
ncbi:transglycosylase domain-containing protein [Clostridiaceae bacterium NSJ-31]|uniref:Penicillin-binding protein 1A n=1 Tax=Ligaoa zhengdingensis TaxID=2763658 RepID=A0A926I574_9FIRM|nr:transglycosylase domain-containing protein [Ligaoa zhengdingensis]MBC8547160.1 transglycosylase domain-containing protein [Ligaoa zhengdingensis]